MSLWISTIPGALGNWELFTTSMLPVWLACIFMGLLLTAGIYQVFGNLLR